MTRGHLEERRPGVWRYRAPAPKSITGRPRQHSRTFRAETRKAAERQAAKMQVCWDEDDAAYAQRAGSLAELVDDYEHLRARRDSPTTIYRRRAILERIRSDLGHLRLERLTARHLDGWYADLLAAGLAPNTVRQYHATIRAILQLGWDYDRVPANIAAKAHPPERTRTDQTDRMPTPAAVAAMLSTTTRSVRMAVLLAAATGARRGEIVGLCWSDLDGPVLTIQRALVKVPGGKLTAKPTKTGTVKHVALPDVILTELAVHRAHCAAHAQARGVEYSSDGPILANMRDDPTGRTPYQPGWLSLEWSRLCAKCGLPNFTLHGLRHMHGSVLADAGVSLAAIAKRQGHGVQVLADRYLHPVDDADRHAATLIGGMIGELIPGRDKAPAAPEG